jgi:hypothetical protein
LGLAWKAREEGDADLSEHIVAAALKCEEKANALEAAAAAPASAAMPATAKSDLVSIRAEPDIGTSLLLRIEPLALH